MILQRMTHRLVGVTPMFSLVMTAICVLGALFVVYMDLGTGALAIWMIASGVWFSLAVRAADSRGGTHR